MDSEESNPNSLNYYLGYIFSLAITYAVIMMLQSFIKNRNEAKTSLNVTMDYYGAKTGQQVVHDVLSKEQRSTRFKFLLASVVVKAATWVKAPYLFALYNRVHGFTRTDIGVLYAIDNITSLVLGPVFGSLSDMYGRKKFCVLYCICVMTHISLRITGSQFLAYFAQIVTGMCSCLLETSFESWINFEANKLFPGYDVETEKQMKNSYLREIFSRQITLDCFCSIVLTGFATILYNNFGILYPFYACFVLALIAALIISFTWDENKMELIAEKEKNKEKHTFTQKLQFSWSKLKEDHALLCVGGIESCFKISLQLFLFIWTPLLEETVGSYVHPGAIFACFMFARLIGSEVFEFLKIILRTNSYLVTIVLTTTSAISFLMCYYVMNFETRLFLFIYFDGISGIFSPLFSSLKAQMIPEKLRSTIMNFFRIPINITSILFLILTRYVTTYQICGLCFFIMTIGTMVNLYLFRVHTPPDAEKRRVKKTSDFMLLYNTSKEKAEKLI